MKILELVTDLLNALAFRSVPASFSKQSTLQHISLVVLALKMTEVRNTYMFNMDAIRSLHSTGILFRAGNLRKSVQIG